MTGEFFESSREPRWRTSEVPNGPRTSHATFSERIARGRGAGRVNGPRRPPDSTAPTTRSRYSLLADEGSARRGA